MNRVFKSGWCCRVPVTFVVFAACMEAAAQGPAANTNSFASPLRVRDGEPAAYDGSAVRVHLDQDLLETIRAAKSFALHDFVLAPENRGGQPRIVTLDLYAMKVFGPETRFVIGDPTGQGKEIQLPLPDVVMFEGSIVAEPESNVFLSFSTHGIYGFVTSGEGTQIISSGKASGLDQPADEALIFDPRVLPEGAIHWSDFVCGTAPPKEVPQLQGGVAGGAPPCREVLLAIESDYEFTNDLFSGNLAAASNYVAVMVGAASNRFKIAINARLRLGYVRLWDNAADPWTMTGTGPQMDQFQQVWEASMEWVPRNLAHFFSGRDLGGGVAWLETVCNPWWAYAVSANLDGSFPYPMVNNNGQNWDIYVFCHELGHNFGAPHTHEYCPPVDKCAAQAAWGPCQDETVCVSTGTILSYCHTCSGGMNNIVLQFHAASAQSMLTYLDTVYSLWGCTLDCPPPATLLVPQNYPTIQAAINASVDGDQVVLADGVYTGTGNKQLNFNGRLITVRSASGNPAACIIDCQNAGNAFLLNHAETSQAVISGLTLTNSGVGVSIGGGCAVTIDHCVLAANGQGIMHAGGVGVGGGANISGCSFIANTGGGAIVMSANTTATISNCTFEGNSTLNAGGAIYSAGTLRITDCTFVNNSSLNSTTGGGAVAVTFDDVVITNCVFVGNHAHATTGKGGALQLSNDSALVINCLFSGNAAGANSGGSGGAIYTVGGNHRIVNCTMYANTANSGGGIYSSANSPLITNCILWGNTPQQAVHTGAGSLLMTYSDIQGGFTGGGNLNVDPMFIDPNGADNVIGTEDDNLRVPSSSPVIDAGTNHPHHFQRAADEWLSLRPAAETRAFDQGYPGIVNGTGCLWGPSPAVLPLAGGTVTVSALDTSNNLLCPILDGSTPSAVADGALSAPVSKLRLDFNPPITAFHTFYGSLASGKVGMLKLFSGNVQVAQFTSAASPDNVLATGHGFSALVPIDEIEVTSTDTAVVMGAFVGLETGEPSLGTINIPGYAGPQGPSVLKDFGVVFGAADLPGDLDANPRVANGNGGSNAIVDMGAYEYQAPICPADIAPPPNGDGIVNTGDLLAIINSWGACAGCPADIAPPSGGDNIVNTADLLAVINGWGACP